MAHRVLVLRLSSLGDVALTAPVFKNLKAHWPDARVCAMVKPQFSAALSNNPCVDEIIPYRNLRQAVQEIRARRFTHLLDLHSTWRSFWIRFFARVPNVSIYKKHAVARRLYVLFRWSSPVLTMHSLDRYLESLAPWGVPIRFRHLSLGDYGSERYPLSQTPSQRVLLVQTSFLGDALLTIPLARRIKETLPGCRLTVLTRPKTMDIFRRTECVDEVLAYDKRAAHAGVKGLWSLASSLRRQRFDLALVAHRSFRSALLVWLTRIPHRIGFSSSAGWFLFNRTVFFPWGMPELERNLALLLPLKPDLRAQTGDSLYLSRSNGTALAERLRSCGIAAKDILVGVHPGSVWPTKRWPAERYAELIRELVARAGVKAVLLGGKEDAALNAGIAEAAGPGVVNWAGCTTLPELMDLVPRLRLMVTNDSGPMHIAAGSGVPTLAIFGPTTRELGFFPYGEGHRVLQVPLECRPCGLHGSRSCPEGHFLCMRLIGVREAVDNALQMLGKSPEGTSPLAPPEGREPGGKAP